MLIKNLYGKKKKPNQKKYLKKGPKFRHIFSAFLFFFFVVLVFFLPTRIFISKKEVFSAGGVAAGAFFMKKVQNFGENFGLFFGQNFGPFFLASFLIL